MALTPAWRDLYADPHPLIVLQKGAQTGGSEWMVNTALWGADTGQGRGNVVLFSPTDGASRDFTQARVDRAIVESDYLVERVGKTTASRQAPDRQGLKRVGRGFIYFRGSDSLAQLASVDADIVLLDEFDLMQDGVLDRAFQRIGSSEIGLVRVTSTPTAPETGINGPYLQSDQNEYELPCPRCGHAQVLTWEDNVDQDRALLVCRRPKCRVPLNVWAEGRWVPRAPGNTRIRGYQLSRLYSPFLNLERVLLERDIASWSSEQTFQNQVLGQVHVPPGGRLTVHDLDRARTPYACPPVADDASDMGVDVGTVLHVVIRAHAPPHQLWFAGTVPDFAALEPLLEVYGVQATVIDGRPETHSAGAFARAHPGCVWLADYDRHLPGHEAKPAKGRQPALVHLNRTEALDELMALIREGQLPLPAAARELGGAVHDGFGAYYRHLLAPQRLLAEDADGNRTARWRSAHDDDYAHAEVYRLAAGRRRRRRRRTIKIYDMPDPKPWR